MSSAPKFIAVRFDLNTLSGWYCDHGPAPHPRLSDALKVEPTFSPELRAQGANEVIHGPKRGGRWGFFTGMQPVRDGWFMGNDYAAQHGTKVRHLCLFRFTENDHVLTVFYFPQFWPNVPTRRIQFAQDFAARVDGGHMHEGQG